MVSNLHIQPPFFVLNCLQIRIKGLSPSSFTTTSASFHSPQMSQPHMLYFSRCPISAKILRLPKMFTSTVHNISHHQGTGTSQTYPRTSAPRSVRCPLRSAFLCIRKGFCKNGSHPQKACQRQAAQRSLHCLFHFAPFPLLDIMSRGYRFSFKQ